MRPQKVYVTRAAPRAGAPKAPVSEGRAAASAAIRARRSGRLRRAAADFAALLMAAMAADQGLRVGARGE